MKKTFPVNINGSVFYIDEDAYNLLNTYTDQLRKAFPGKEGSETVDDIESRIAEIFTERAAAGGNVITITDVNNIIEQMGRPDDLTDNDSNSQPDTDGGADTDNSASSGPTPPPFNSNATPIAKHLYRDERNKVFGGVIAGLALYLGWNVTIMRVLLVILALCSHVWPLVIIYLFAWMIIPPARTPRQILQMTGQPVTVVSVGQTVLNVQATAGNYSAPSTVGFGSILGKICLGFLGFIGACLSLCMIFLLITGISALILYCGWGDLSLLHGLSIADNVHLPVLSCISVICVSIAVLIPSLAAVWAGCNALFNLRGISRGAVIAIAIFEILLIIASIVMVNICDFYNPMIAAATIGIAGPASVWCA